MLYGCAIFLSSFLLFAIQPVFAKLILAWFGGSAAVWTTCLVFYQVALLGGYFYAHAIVDRLNARAQAAVHTILLAAAVAVLPVIPGESWKPHAADNPGARILLLLTVVLGLPYFMLSTTGPLLQSWYAARHKRPYRLFALSNAGALLALLAYPLLIEPKIPARAQAVWWSGGFALFAMLGAIVAWTGQTRAEHVRTQRAKISARPRVTWIALAAGGSMLLLSTTSQLTQNVAAVPFLWILPLAIYLVTFILCFESARFEHRRGLFEKLLAMALGAVGYAIYDIQVSDAIVISIPIFCAALFIGCMYCHGELAALKPAPEALTSFYLMIALGGAAGAVFMGLIAPAAFSGIYDLPFALLFLAALALTMNWRHGWSARLLWSVATLAMAVVIGAQIRGYHRNTIAMARNFYGALRLVEADGARTLYHGTVKHGSQFLSTGRRDWPTSYYGPSSGIGLTLLDCCPGAKRVGVIGLGAGTLSAYAKPSDEFHFYEINPQVIAIARERFTFLRDANAKIEITPGDARLALENETPQNFDVLAVDAFSGDAIPVHLLTKEAVSLYLWHLKPRGVLAIHVSNQYLDLAPVAAQLAAFHGLQAVEIHSPKDDDRGLSAATWVLATRSRDFLSRAAIANAAEPIPPRDLRMWTDDYNNLLQVLR